MIEKRLEDLEARYNELSELLGLPDVAGNAELYQKYAREHASLHDLVEIYRKMKAVDRQLEGNRQILEGKDEELRELAKEEIPAQLPAEVEQQIHFLQSFAGLIEQFKILQNDGDLPRNLEVDMPVSRCESRHGHEAGAQYSRHRCVVDGNRQANEGFGPQGIY